MMSEHLWQVNHEGGPPVIRSKELPRISEKDPLSDDG